MNAPLDRYELYRVIGDYEALIEGFADRIEDLDTTLEQIDMAGDFAKGNVQKLLSQQPSVRGWDRQRRDKRILGWESLGKMLSGTGLALVLVVDDGRFAETKAQLLKRRLPRLPAIAGMRKTPWLFKGKKAREMGKKRFSLMTDAERKRHQRKAAKARWRKQHREERLSARASMPDATALSGQHSAICQPECLATSGA